MKPTFHLDKNGRMIHESDNVRTPDFEGRVDWEERWVISAENGDKKSLNNYSKDKLEII